MARKQTDLLGSFAKGLSVIECFSAERARLTISDVSLMTGLDRATARRCLLTLSELAYADYDGKHFTLTPRVLRLGTSCLATMPLPRIVQPLLDKLSTEIGQSTSVSILDGAEIVYVARAAQQRLMSINLMPGSRLPASCSSMGRVLLAAFADSEIRKILRTNPPVKRTAKTIISQKLIIKEVQQVRRDGFAIVDQEIEIGLRSIAVPLYNARGQTVAAVNVGVAAVQNSADELRLHYFDKLLVLQKTLIPLL
jgi:IclR family transcriptional regulator, pca regulon regulatory protein